MKKESSSRLLLDNAAPNMLPVENWSSESSMLSTTESRAVAPSAKERSWESRSWSGSDSAVESLTLSTGVASSKKVSCCRGGFVLRARMVPFGLWALDGPVGVVGRSSSCAKAGIVVVTGAQRSRVECLRYWRRWSPRTGRWSILRSGRAAPRGPNTDNRRRSSWQTVARAGQRVVWLQWRWMVAQEACAVTCASSLVASSGSQP